MKVIKTYAFILFLVLGFSVNAQEFKQNDAATSVSFKIKNFGSFVNGSFSEVDISTNFDRNNLENSNIKGIIKVNSIDTNNKKRDNHLRADDYFDASKYPEIKLASTKIEKANGDTFTLTAQLTIKKTTKTVTLPITIKETNSTIDLKADFNIDRRDYGVGGNSWVLSDTVYIGVVYSAKK